ncbi:MAG: helix-turn-helix transcriptional regulator [Bacteriovoracia bacterium]
MQLDQMQRRADLWYGQASQRHLCDALFEKKIWRVDDVARFLGCSVGHVYNLASDEKIPKLKKRGFLFFVPEQILNWVMEGNES